MYKVTVINEGKISEYEEDLETALAIKELWKGCEGVNVVIEEC